MLVEGRLMRNRYEEIIEQCQKIFEKHGIKFEVPEEQLCTIGQVQAEFPIVLDKKEVVRDENQNPILDSDGNKQYKYSLNYLVHYDLNYLLDYWDTDTLHFEEYSRNNVIHSSQQQLPEVHSILDAIQDESVVRTKLYINPITREPVQLIALDMELKEKIDTAMKKTIDECDELLARDLVAQDKSEEEKNEALESKDHEIALKIEANENLVSFINEAEKFGRRGTLSPIQTAVTKVWATLYQKNAKALEPTIEKEDKKTIQLRRSFTELD